MMQIIDAQNVASSGRNEPRFPYRWRLADLKAVKQNGLKVFSCFACGGGSTMGYKLAGFEVVGCNEIDPEMMGIYKLNHHPRHAFLESIQTFKDREDLPAELFDLDILDGSPPCSTFSMSGDREKAWGAKKKFREGQADQVLSNLFFDYIDLAERLCPKIIIAENVKGMVSGKAKGYCKLIKQRLEQAGYDVQLFLLNAVDMGVPQKRERLFFVSRRRDLNLPPISLEFNGPHTTFAEACGDLINSGRPSLTQNTLELWNRCEQGRSLSTVHPRGSRFNAYKLAANQVAGTLTSSGEPPLHPTIPRRITSVEIMRLSSWPEDYCTTKPSQIKYITGMSVPPVMMANIAFEITQQWGDSLKNG